MTYYEWNFLCKIMILPPMYKNYPIFYLLCGNYKLIVQIGPILGQPAPKFEWVL